MANNNEFIILSKQNSGDNTIATPSKSSNKIEESTGKFSAENLFSNFDQFSPSLQKSLREYAALISKNAQPIPMAVKMQLISIRYSEIQSHARKALDKVYLQNAHWIKRKWKITKNDQELSQQLRGIIAAFEQEIMLNSYTESQAKQAALRRSMRWAGLAAILAFLIVGLFSFLINRDFWKIQTYQQKLEKEKKYSESLLQSREQLISTVSHDLRTPLNTISGYAELMENTDLTSKQGDYIKNVKSASEYVGNLVNDLLDFSKLEAGKLNIEKVPF